MKYPNGKKNTKASVKITSSKRGMSLEEDINVTCAYYREKNIAIIYKKPTPISIVKVDYPKRSLARITEAYFSKPSTTDYNGIYNGKYIDFEAKECSSTSAFPFSSIHEHQINHLEAVLNHGAIAFIIIRMTKLDVDYVVMAKDFIDYYKNTTRKSLPVDWLKQYGYEIISNYIKPCDFIEVIKKII